MTQQLSPSTGDKQWRPVSDFLKAEIVPVEDAKYADVRNLFPDWHSEANCKAVAEEAYFGGVAHGQRYYTDVINPSVLSLCRTCPVVETCLEACLTNKEEYGIWACTTPRERQELFKQAKRGTMTWEECAEKLREISRERRDRTV